MPLSARCTICQAPAFAIGSKVGKWRSEEYHLVRCGSCAFAFVTNPSVDYENIYSEEYYAGRGADKLVNYSFELENAAKTIRTFEWRGIQKIVGSLVPLDPNTRWLDYGCGSGGLVRYLRTKNIQADGYEQSPIVPIARKMGIPILDSDDLLSRSGYYDVISVIEVIEHLVEPRAFFEQVSRLLRPGGVAFFTTGNALPVRANLLSWSYFIPEIHVGLYEPQSLEKILTLTGFQPRYLGWKAGYDDVITFKILKNLRFDHTLPIFNLIPLSPVPYLADKKFGVSAFPIGIKAS